MNPSGLRIGTPALTTRGLVEDDMREIAEIIGSPSPTASRPRRRSLRERTRALMAKYPLYPQPRSDRPACEPPPRLGPCGSGSTAPPRRTRWSCGRSSSACASAATRSASPPASTARRRDPRPPGPRAHGRRAPRRRLDPRARRARWPRAARRARWAAAARIDSRSPTARWTSPSSRRSLRIPSARCRTTSTPACSARSASGLPGVLVPDAIPDRAPASRRRAPEQARPLPRA